MPKISTLFCFTLLTTHPSLLHARPLFSSASCQRGTPLLLAGEEFLRDSCALIRRNVTDAWWHAINYRGQCKCHFLHYFPPPLDCSLKSHAIIFYSAFMWEKAIRFFFLHWSTTVCKTNSSSMANYILDITTSPPLLHSHPCGWVPPASAP